MYGWGVTRTLLLLLMLSGCALTSHAVQPSSLGKVSGSQAMLEVLDQAGPLEVETVVSCDWSVSLEGLVNLDHEKAKAAGLVEREEPIQVYFHVVRHPSFGTFVVDTGIEKAYRDAPGDAAIQGLVASVMGTEKLKPVVPLGDWVAKNGKLEGVFLTHMHVDHVSGMPDVPKGTPIYAGPGESAEVELRNLVLQKTMNRLLEGHAPTSELQFAADPDGRFDGVIDVFGDGSFWAIWVPGHTVGSVAYVARTASGPVMMVGDSSHTRWGWENGVEPGKFTGDGPRNAVQLQRLKALAAEHPAMSVRLGHQPMTPTAE